MNISEPRYFLFLGVLFLLYYALKPGAPRRILLLAASYFFYFEVSRVYVLVLLLVTALTYFGAQLLGSIQEQKRTLFFSLVGLVVLIPLLVFKYLGALFLVFGDSRLATLAIPVGISFFTFAALGYLFDVYLEVSDPERDWQRVSLFLAFFPLITAGPIERGSFMAQFDLDNKFSADSALTGLRLILIGLVLKIILAENLGDTFDTVFAAPAQHLPLENLVAAINFTFFIYADFAGYTLIAIGSALMFGLRVRPNFQQPFLSATIPEFWRHWHMSLSFWVRDYIFAPLRTSWRHLGQFGMAAALFVSIVVIGIWHGPKWGYLGFGLMHATFIVVSTLTLTKRDAFWKSIRIPMALLYTVRVLITFALVVLAFVVFRADTIHDALVIYGRIFSFGLIENLGRIAHLPGFNHGPAVVLAGMSYRPLLIILLIVVGDILVRKKLTVEKYPALLQWALYSVAIVKVLNAWVNTYAPHPFVYNKF